jgi:hypothetical protein
MSIGILDGFPTKEWTSEFVDVEVNKLRLNSKGTFAQQSGFERLSGYDNLKEIGRHKCTADMCIALEDEVEGKVLDIKCSRAYFIRAGVAKAGDKFEAGGTLVIPKEICNDIHVLWALVFYMYTGILVDVGHLTDGTGDFSMLERLENQMEIMRQPEIKFDLYQLYALADFLDIRDLMYSLRR